MLQFCETTQKHFLYPRRSSPFVLAGKVSWVRACGRGRLYSYVISHSAPPGWTWPVPYAIAIVELEEGVRMMASIVDVPADPDFLPLDLPLEVAFRPCGEWMLPVFRPRQQVAG